MSKRELNIKEKIFFSILVAGWVFGSVYGLHNDWTAYIILCPLIWVIPGMLLAFMVYGKNASSRACLVGVFSFPIIANTAFMLIHRDTDFIVGRLVLTIVMVFAIIVVTSADDDDQQKPQKSDFQIYLKYKAELEKKQKEESSE